MSERRSTPSKDSKDRDRRTGPTTGNNRGNDLPSDAKTTRDTRRIGDPSGEDTQSSPTNVDDTGETDNTVKPSEPAV